MRDLAELEEQMTAGEIDADAALQLRETYSAEAERAQVELTAFTESEGRRALLRPRSLAGAAVLLAAIAVAADAITHIVSDGSSSTAGGIVADALTGIDLDEISDEDLEAQVAENPDLDEDNPLALAILAVIRLDGLNDAAGARDALDQLSANPNLPDELRSSVEEMRPRTEAGS